MDVSDAKMVEDGPVTKDTVEEGIAEAGAETETEDEDPEATKRYWEVKRKKDGIHMVT